ncbi:NAD(+) diphosphatase [Actinoallomurus bryophytorum]|uniref:NAD(+) diphosphatase n=1 Tax=Actinoallomurus bryophytorum TaxID=1490222 RepID=A0A543CEU3_9ACTN|nr:NAD(+) diphosphatase [Actinoallomurus bryophytorum]TQL95618.1 NAD+ diphosphatase [Actinoallomurus bryophytorum]
MTETTLDWLALSRGALDRVGERRRDDAWLTEAWADARTRAFAIDHGKVLIRPDPALVLLGPDQAPEGERYLLGVDEDGVAYFAVAAPLPAIEGTEPAGLRGVGALLSDRDAGLLTQAVALQNWHETHAYCPRHGAPTTPASAGHTRVCPVDGAEQFPRTDPAVIMLVHDDERMLLASSANWPMRRASVLAGFVEVGESLEQAVAREVYEEVGIRVHDCRYLGSQPWPLPRSLMLGFFARAEEGQELRVDGEEIMSARWYTRAELLAATESGELLLPGRISIARQLIERWYGGELPGDW